MSGSKIKDKKNKKDEKKYKGDHGDDDWEELGRMLEASDKSSLGGKILKGVKSVRRTLERKKAEKKLKQIAEAWDG